MKLGKLRFSERKKENNLSNTFPSPVGGGVRGEGLSERKKKNNILLIRSLLANFVPHPKLRTLTPALSQKGEGERK